MSKYLLILFCCLLPYSLNAQGFGAGVDEAIIMEKGNQEQESTSDEVDAGLEEFREAASDEFGGEEVEVANIQEPAIDSTATAKASEVDGYGHFKPIILLSAVAAISVIVFIRIKKSKK